MVVSFIMKGPTAAPLNTFIALRSKLHKRQEEGKVTSYFEAVNHLLEMYAVDEVIAEADADTIRLSQTFSKVRTEYAEYF